MEDRSAGPVAAAPARRAAELPGWGRIAPSTPPLAEAAHPAQVARPLAGARAAGAPRAVRGLGGCGREAGQGGVPPGDPPRLFWATAGGMGLTGIILAAAVQLTPVPTSRVRVDTVRTADVDETMACLSDTDDRYGYTVAWKDCLARGTRLGRSGVTS